MPTLALSPVIISTCINSIKLMCSVSLFFVMAKICSGVGSICLEFSLSYSRDWYADIACNLR